MKAQTLFPRSAHPLASVTFLLLAVVVVTPSQSRAATIWNGPLLRFSKADFTDPTLPADQDRLTPNVWLTRGTDFGLYNAKTEVGFTHFLSPADTAWADGSLANYASLSYTDWNTWAKVIHGAPPSTVGVNAVVHLISEDIYLSLKFDSWSGPGGGFAYDRSTPPVVPEPAPASLLLTGLVMARAVQRRRRRARGPADPGQP